MELPDLLEALAPQVQLVRHLQLLGQQVRPAPRGLTEMLGLPGQRALPGLLRLLLAPPAPLEPTQLLLAPLAPQGLWEAQGRLAPPEQPQLLQGLLVLLALLEAPEAPGQRGRQGLAAARAVPDLQAPRELATLD